MSWAAAIVAAGRGTRLGRPKQLIDVAGIPLAGWAMRSLAAMPEIEDVVVVTDAEFLEPMRDLAQQIFGARPVRAVTGGATRQASVRRALDALPDRCTHVLIHDGARPLVRARDVRAGMNEVREGRGAVLATPVVDTIKIVDPRTMTVAETLPRGALWAAQTPQFGTRADFERAHREAERAGVEATDDVALLERIGIAVAIVPSTGENFKVTVEEDLLRAELLLRENL
ncbi:MAG TPA: 2-C-methyl-D-erythritol 4-phosphate cytidylyltransferase [Candidatus Baltobacteraceae bacterium]